MDLSAKKHPFPQCTPPKVPPALAGHNAPSPHPPPGTGSCTLPPPTPPPPPRSVHLHTQPHPPACNPLPPLPYNGLYEGEGGSGREKKTLSTH